MILDTNVVLNVLLDRQPHAQASAQVIVRIEWRTIRRFLAANAVTTLNYLVSQHLGTVKSRLTINSLMVGFQIATVDRIVLDEALRLPLADFEAAVTAAAAHAAKCEFVVTRDPKGFRKSPVRAISSEEFPALQ